MSTAADLPEASYRSPAAGPAEARGAGAPLVLVHGIGGSWRNWLPVIPALEREHEVLAVGLLGHHPSRPFDDGVRPSVAALVDGLERELDEAGFGQVHLVGNSLGGWIALELAKRGRALSVVAFSPGGGYAPGSLTADLTALRLVLEHRVAGRWLAPRAERLVSRPRLRRLLFAGTFGRPERVSAAEGAHMLRAFGGAGVFVDLMRSMKVGGPLTDLDRIQAPVLLAWGTRDLVLPMRSFSKLLREGIPGVEFHELRGLGHVPMVDDPELVSELILDFVRRHEAPAAPTAARQTQAAGQA
jgi:pimeloyl-ACP methyl ester carboxylesterase